jgi:CO dehydrogenase/acetyl-CoA synthase epsilon subunit
MNTASPTQVADYLKGRRDVLMLAGYQCDELAWEDRRLSDYAAEVALKLGAPVAATGNSVVALKQRGAQARKRVAMEIVEMLRHEKWRDPIIEEKPGLLVLVGYPRGIAQALVSAAKGVETVVLGNAAIDGATYCLLEGSLKEYRHNLDLLLEALEAQAG